MRRRPLLALAGLALALAGCATTHPKDPKLAQSAGFLAGYNDGCSTARARSKVFDRTIVRDDTAYDKDDLYHRGWNEGFRECGSPQTQDDPYAEPVTDWQRKGGPLGN